jgi:hypothetical protein
MRRFTPVELAVGAAILGSLLAVAVPAFCRDLHAYAEANQRFPESAPLTPSAPPRGKKEADPPGTWDGATWRALSFRPSAEGVPHAYAFSFESTAGGTAFVAQARGDLDGDGVLSTFEIRGHASRAEGERPALASGMYVEGELE